MEIISLSERSANEGFEDHLKLAQEKKLEEDVEKNNAVDVVPLLLTFLYITDQGHNIQPHRAC